MSAALLLAADLLLGAAWWTCRPTSSTSYTAQLPSTLLGIELEVAEGDVEIVGGTGRDVFVSRVDSSAFGHTPDRAALRRGRGGETRVELGRELVIGTCASDYRRPCPTDPLRIVAEHGDIRVTAYRGSAVLSTRDGSVAVDPRVRLDPRRHGRQAGTSTSGRRAPPAPDDADRFRRHDRARAARPVQHRRGDARRGRDPRRARRRPRRDARIQALSNSGDVTVEAG